MFESIKVLENKTSVLFNSLAILFHHVSFSFISIDLYFLIVAVIAQMFNPIAEFVILIRMPIKEAKTETKIHPVTVETEIRQCSI